MEILMPFQTSEEIKNSTEVLIEQAQNGDEEAFGMIFDQHHLFIYKFIYAMLGNHSQAEELTQETFLGAYKTIKQRRNESTLKTWLCAIAKNMVYTSLRSKKKEIWKSDEEIETLHLADKKNPLPDKQVLNKELNRVILSALEKLNEDKRMVFILREMHELSYQEISDITGSTLSKVKVDLFRAKVEMRAMLRSYVKVKK